MCKTRVTFFSATTKFQRRKICHYIWHYYKIAILTTADKLRERDNKEIYTNCAKRTEQQDAPLSPVALRTATGNLIQPHWDFVQRNMLQSQAVQWRTVCSPTLWICLSTLFIIVDFVLIVCEESALDFIKGPFDSVCVCTSYTCTTAYIERGIYVSFRRCRKRSPFGSAPRLRHSAILSYGDW